MSTKPLLRAGAAARILGCSTEWVRRLAESGALECQRDSAGGRLYPEAAVRALAQQRRAAKRRTT